VTVLAAVAQRTRRTSGKHANGIQFFRGTWNQCLSLNANNLVWTALVVGNALLATVLTRG
jgi:hypothetical protein